MSKPKRTPWNSRYSNSTAKEMPRARYEEVTARVAAAEQAIASGACPEDGQPLGNGRCLCGFALQVLEPYSPPRAVGAGFNRRCTVSTRRLPQIGSP